MAIAAISAKPLEGRLIDLLLESLRRDAFVMEAFNYEEPAIAEPEDFQRVFTVLYRQIAALYGGSAVLVTAIDARGCRNKETKLLERRVVTGIGLPDLDCQVWQSSEPATIGLPSLTRCVDLAKHIVDFCSKATPSFSDFFNRNPIKTKTIAVVCPYFVKSIDRPLADAKYRDIVNAWEENPWNPDLMYTRPYVGGVPERISRFEGAYFAAVLLVYVSPVWFLDTTRLSCLEAIHLSFQISWGVPALEEQKRELGELRRAGEDFRRRSESFRQLQVLAHTISSKIHEHSQKLIRELDPGTGIDREDLAYLFQNSTTAIWTGRGVTVHGLHDYSPEPLTAQAICYYAIHRIFDRLPSETLTVSDLQNSAARLVESPEVQGSPILSLFLARVLQADEFAFDLFKEITCRVHIDNAELPFFAIAARLFLGPVDDDFSVEIRHVDGSHVTLSRSNFLRADLSRPFLTGPTFHQNGVRPREWVIPLVDLLAIQLRGLSKEKNVTVPHISLVRKQQHSEVICPLRGSIAGVMKVTEILRATPTEDWCTRGLRGDLWRLHTARQKFSRDFAWSVNEDEGKSSVVFRVG